MVYPAASQITWVKQSKISWRELRIWNTEQQRIITVKGQQILLSLARKFNEMFKYRIYSDKALKLLFKIFAKKWLSSTVII